MNTAEKCKYCDTEIDFSEIYGDWFFCIGCLKNFSYRRERTNPEDVDDDGDNILH